MKKLHALNPVAESDYRTRYVMLFMEMLLKTELWKLKTPKMCF